MDFSVACEVKQSVRGSWRSLPFWPRRGVCAAALVVATTGPLRAQAQAEFGIRGGLYLPVGAVIEQGAAGSKLLQKHQLGAGFLAILGKARVVGRLAVEGDLVFSPSMVAVRDSTGVRDRSAPVVLASLRTVLALGSSRSAFAGTGIGVVRRHGEVWAGTRGTTLPALVLVAGWQAPQKKGLPAARLQVEDHVSRVAFDQAFPNQTRERLHHELLWSVGLMIPLGGR